MPDDKHDIAPQPLRVDYVPAAFPPGVDIPGNLLGCGDKLIGKIHSLGHPRSHIARQDGHHAHSPRMQPLSQSAQTFRERGFGRPIDVVCFSPAHPGNGADCYQEAPAFSLEIPGDYLQNACRPCEVGLIDPPSFMEILFARSLVAQKTKGEQNTVWAWGEALMKSSMGIEVRCIEINYGRLDLVAYFQVGGQQPEGIETRPAR